MQTVEISQVTLITLYAVAGISLFAALISSAFTGLIIHYWGKSDEVRARLEQAKEAAAALLKKQIQYDVAAVAPHLAEHFEAIHVEAVPLQAFVEGVCANHAYADQHEALRADLRRLSAQHAGKRLYVSKVRNMP